MFLIVIGVIIFIAGIIFRSFPTVARYAKGTILGGIIVMLIGLSISCFIQIDAGHVGVKKLFGKVQPSVLESGLHFINPLFEIEKLDVKTQNYTMSGLHDEGQKQGDDAIRVLTADGLAEAFSPMLVARLRDVSANYANGFAALIILAIIGIIAVAMLPKKTNTQIT